MNDKSETSAWQSNHDVFWLSEDEVVYRSASTGLDWSAHEADGFYRATTNGSLREFVREFVQERATQAIPAADNFIAHPVHHRFEIYAQLNPGAGAIKCGQTELTYGELDAQADALAARLQQDGLGPGEFCALYMSASPAMIRAILAILKAGAACLLLNPETPSENIADMLAVSQPRIVITQEHLLYRLDATDARIRISADDADDPMVSWPQEYPTMRFSPAFAIFAFSVTGSMSIVVRSHMATVSRVDSMRARTLVRYSDAILPDPDHALDILDFLWPLSHGARIVIPLSQESQDATVQTHTREANACTCFESMGLQPVSPSLHCEGNEMRELRELRESLWSGGQPAALCQDRSNN
jgi:surfactin family lipopeptide synthetase A